MEQEISLVSNYLQIYGLNIIGSILIFLIGKKVAQWLAALTYKMMKRSETDETLAKFGKDLLYALLLVAVVMAALSNAGVNVTSLIAVLGAVGLAVGLALQGTLSNIGASTLIMIFRPFKIGDYVDAGGTSGSVDEINLFSTILNTPDNKRIIVPNSQIISGAITNFSANNTRRVDWTFGIGYDDDLKLAKSVLEEIVRADSRVLGDPAPFVAVSELADSSVNFVVRAWVKSSDYWGVHFDTIEKVKTTFDEKNISIPYPQMDMHQK